MPKHKRQLQRFFGPKNGPQNDRRLKSVAAILHRQLMAPWEMRLGNLRVYYEVEQEPEPVVRILAVGIKERNRIRIGKEVIDL